MKELDKSTLDTEFVRITNDPDLCVEKIDSVVVEYMDTAKKDFNGFGWATFGPGILKNTPIKDLIIVYRNETTGA